MAFPSIFVCDEIDSFDGRGPPGAVLGRGILSPFMYDMNSSSDRTFQFTNSNGGVAHLDVEGNVSAAGFNVSTSGTAARAGSSAIASGATAQSVSTAAVGRRGWPGRIEEPRPNRPQPGQEPLGHRSLQVPRA